MNEGESNEIKYDYLGRRIYTPVSEAGIDSDEYSDVADYATQKMEIDKMRKDLAEKALRAQIEMPHGPEVMTYEDHGAIYIFDGLSYAIKKEYHGPVPGENYIHFHLLDMCAKNPKTNVCASVLAGEATGCNEVYLEPHGDNLEKGRSNIKKITSNENEIKVRDALLFLAAGDPQDQRRSPKKKKATLLATDIPPRYSFERTK